MSSVNLLMTELYQIIDARANDGSEITIANVGSVDGEKFTAAKALAIYNNARYALANAVAIRMDPFAKRQAISDNTVWNTTFAFASGVANKEAGYIEHKDLQTLAGIHVSVVPAHNASLIAYLDSAQNPIVFERAATFNSIHGNTFIPDASTYIHVYYGISPWVNNDVIAAGSLASETFSPVWESPLLEIAEAIAMEKGLAQVNKLALTLVGGAQ